MNNRNLINAKLEFCPVSQNDKYIYSIKHTVSIYPIDAVYTFIPKNACSSLRYSIALMNGFISDINEIRWTHQNNETFNSSQREIAIASYTFVILRCPFTRIASCFFDKIVGGEFDFKDESGEKLSISFNEFLQVIKSQNRRDRNEHWRNQSDFLHYEEYDDYFSLELFSEATEKLSVKGLEVVDTRIAHPNSLLGITRLEGDFSKAKEQEIRKMKEDGFIPSYKSMYQDDEIQLVKDIYEDDIALYKKHFGKKNLLFK